MESNFLVIDSSVIIAAYDTKDTLHERALKIIGRSADKIFYLHPYVIQEVVTVFSYRFGSASAIAFIASLGRSDNVFILSPFVQEEMDFFVKLNKKISFTDATLIKIATEKKIPVLTFDKQIISILKKL